MINPNRLVSLATRATPASRNLSQNQIQVSGIISTSISVRVSRARCGGSGSWTAWTPVRPLLATLDSANAEGHLDVNAVWAALEKIAPRAQLAAAVALVEELAPEEDGSAETAMRVLLAERYRTVRPFLALLGWTSSLRAGAGGVRVLAAVRSLPELAARKVKAKPLLPADIDAPRWCRRCGPARSTAIRQCLTVSWAATPTCCACWSSCARHCGCVTCTPRRHSAGVTREPAARRPGVGCGAPADPGRARADRTSTYPSA